MSFTCVVIGHGPQAIACAELLLGRGHRLRGIVSDCPQIRAWTQKAGVARIGTAEDQHEFLAREAFDYLFSIVNHTITPHDLRALATRGAINFHDSPLPSYGGFNATSWAIIDGQTVHGVTWHTMTDDVDAGGILVQTAVPIGDEDTAFSLAAHCSAAAVRSFEDLLVTLESGSPGRAVPTSFSNLQRSFHFRSERPGVAVLDWTQPATALQRLVRGLDLGSEDNWMSTAKLVTPSGACLSVGSAALGPAVSGLPGTLGTVSPDTIEVSAAGGTLVLSGLTTLEGEPLTPELLDRFGLRPQTRLAALQPELLAAADSVDARVTKAERFWVRRLAALADLELPELKPHQRGGAIRRIGVPTAVLQGLSAQDRPAAACAALAAYLARRADEAAFVDLGLHTGALASDSGGGLEAWFASVVPLRLEAETNTPFADLAASARQELDTCVERGTYARDVWKRYASLRQKPAASRRLSIALSLGAFDRAELPDGVCLLLALDPASPQLELVFDSACISPASVLRLAGGLAALLESAIAGTSFAATPLARLRIVPADDETLLLDTWQDTARPVAAGLCVHQLFAAQVERTPDKPALAFRDEVLTYRELDRCANALAHVLRRRGVGPDHLVGLCVERSLQMVVGLLAIHKAGGAYVPLDPAYPRERLAMMLEDSGAKLLLTQKHLLTELPRHGAEVVLVDDVLGNRGAGVPGGAPDTGVAPQHLAYVIFTSGSTGRPKGVMVQHDNVVNFFAGMDDVVGTAPGVWLAVTSISFDISVLELFWTLCRGFEVVIQEEGDRASLLKSQSQKPAPETTVSSKPMAFSLFYFAADGSTAGQDAYRVLLDGARFADSHGFSAVWTPERHFHAFGGLYPNPAVTSAALAVITKNIELRAGSVVIPLHDPLRVAEEWAVVDNLSHGRVGLSFASGWHANDFALKPENYERRREVMVESIDTVLKLWRGEKVKVRNGLGQDIEVGVLPRPVRERPPMWIASAGNVDTFVAAGRGGFNVLTNMLGQDLEDLRKKFAAYRAARRDSGHAGDGTISVMLHTFVAASDEEARELARRPFGNYLATSYDLVKVAPWMFPAFKQPSQAHSGSSAFDPASFDADDMAALLDHAFERYFDTAGLFGTPERALRMVEQLKDIGATEVACLVDFGIAADVVLDNLVHLDALRRLANPSAVATATPSTSESEAATGSVVPVVRGEPVTVRDQFRRRAITHLQCTPSLARMFVADGTLGEMGSLRTLLLGGEALPVDLVERLGRELGAEIHNMYGPTETTVWSTSAPVSKAGGPITIGRPIANTHIRILDRELALVPIGAHGELCIGGAGVVRGYWGRPDLTDERFVADPHRPGARLYRTGDLARYRDDGQIEYIGRIDQQVKVNGYRIELGEIETLLARHPAVKQGVVAVKDGNGGPELVGYVVAQSSEGGGERHDLGDVEGWKQRWNEAYTLATGADRSSARFNTSGWLDSFSGEPIPQPAMREWLDHTVSRILELAPKRVLEIGCGTGMILYACLPHVENYTAVDLSPFALETIRGELDPEERRKVTLLNQAAHELGAMAERSCDLVIINSVAQYFPNAEYLARVLQRASEILVDGGHIFLGDVRSLEQQHAFHTLVELHHAPGQAGAADLSRRIAERAAGETELLLHGGFFDTLRDQVPRLQLSSIQLKRGEHANEMRDFRSDVVLAAGPRAPALDMSAVQGLPSPGSLDEVRAALAATPTAVWVSGLRNPRLQRLLAASAQIAQAEARASAESLRESLQGPCEGIDPNLLHTLHADYTVETRWCAVPGEYEALLRHRQHGPRGPWPQVPAAAAAPWANTPHRGVETEALFPKLKTHLKDYLPEYMLPASFVLLDVFPLTPNGKIDRKALPAPATRVRRPTVEYAVPGNDLERTIATIWQALLGVERVGRKDNIFSLGASSLLTVEANSRLQTLLERKIPLVTMFRYPTIETLAAHLARAVVSGNGSATTVVGAAAPLLDTAEQERQQRIAAAAERRRRARTQSA